MARPGDIFPFQKSKGFELKLLLLSLYLLPLNDLGVRQH